MSNQLEKLKSSIRKEYVNNFELNLMKSSGFIPVDKRQGKLYTIISQSSLKNIETIRETVEKKVQTYGGIEPIPVSDAIFDDVYNYVNKLIQSKDEPQSANVEPKPEPKSEPKPVSPEEMLVTIGWITRAQLEECEAIAEEKNIPLDGVFYDKDYLSYERIVSYLKKKYNCEVISKSNIVVDNSILKLLPDDFVEKKKTIIMSMEDNKLAVAMVNPDDKYTIREISLSTGRSLNVYCIPYFEFEQYLKEYFMLKKTEKAAKETERIIQSIEEEAAQFNNEESLWTQVEKELQDASGNVAKFVYKIITDAIDAKASDIHIEPLI